MTNEKTSKYILASDLVDEKQTVEIYSFMSNETYLGKVESVFHDKRNDTTTVGIKEVTILNENNEPTDFERFMSVECSPSEYVKVIHA